MALHARYELVCLDSKVSEEDAALGIFFPLEGVSKEQWEQAHRVAFALLHYRFTERSQHEYEGKRGTKIILEETTAGSAYAEFSLTKIDVRAVAAIAEIAALLHCEFVPETKGSNIAPTMEALLLDLARRATEAVHPVGATFFEDACAKDGRLRDSELVWNLDMTPSYGPASLATH